MYTCLAASPAGEDSRSFHVSARGSVAPVGRVHGVRVRVLRALGSRELVQPTDPSGDRRGAVNIRRGGSGAEHGNPTDRGMCGGLFMAKWGWMGTGPTHLPPLTHGHPSCSPSQHHRHRRDPQHHRRAGGAAHPGVPCGRCAAPPHRVAPGGLPTAGTCARGLWGRGPPLSPFSFPGGTAADRGCPGALGGCPQADPG